MVSPYAPIHLLSIHPSLMCIVLLLLPICIPSPIPSVTPTLINPIPQDGQRIGWARDPISMEDDEDLSLDEAARQGVVDLTKDDVANGVATG